MMMILPPTMYDGRRSGHGRHDLRTERPDPIGVAMMRLHPVEAAQTFGSLIGQAVQAVFQRGNRRSAPAAR
jgi:hypothetical protein